MTVAALAVAIVMIVAATQAQAQTFTVLHTFTGGNDGGYPGGGGLTPDSVGNFYGTAAYGGSANAGTVFKMTRHGSDWIFSPLYSFQGGTDGNAPDTSVVFGPGGSLYGTTFYGGNSGCGQSGCGTVFKLTPPATICKSTLCPWTETVLHRFQGGSDGAAPAFAQPIFDRAGNMYGTTSGSGGAHANVYELSPSQGGWTYNILYTFTNGFDGGLCLNGVIFDQSGNLYGTTALFGYGYGTVFELTPSGSGWSFNLLHTFTNGSDGGESMSALIFDQSGNLYGTTHQGGQGNSGTAFEMTTSNGSWTLSTLYAFTGSFDQGPDNSLVMDTAGNLYGTTEGDGQYGYGSVYKLTPSGGGWTYTTLHDFTGGDDGFWPYSKLTVDASGNVYGMTEMGGTRGLCPSGGSYGCGVVFEITP
jgi:uncharacterized repeat protein (TIGR03803 family)